MVGPRRIDSTGLVWRLSLAVCIAIGMSAGVVYAQQGQLDVSFGSSGKLVIPFDLGGTGLDGAYAIAVQPDGKIVAVGGAQGPNGDSDFAAVRFGPDGTLDPTFGSGGKTTVWFDIESPNEEYATAVAIHPDGAIYLAGPVAGFGGDPEFGVARLDSSGSLDIGFGVGGKAIRQFDLGGNFDDWPHDIAVLADGKTLVVGEVDGSVGNVDFGVARFTATGTFDLTFGSAGNRVIFFDQGGSNDDNGWTIAVQPDGKIILAGTVDVGVGTTDIGVVRLNSNSTNDTTFGSGGKVTIAFDIGGENVDIGLDVALQQDGKIVVVGAAEATNSWMDFAIARLETDGTLDTTFDGDGKATVTFDLGGDEDDWAYAVALNPDGKIVVAGQVDGPGGPRDFGLARLDANGALDSTFGSGGKTTIAFDQGSGSDDLYGLAVPTSGGIYLAGGVDVAPSGIDFGIAKVMGSVVFGDGFESGDPNAWSNTVP
jgi:uncharacterized delta-60 repeat protein